MPRRPYSAQSYEAMFGIAQNKRYFQFIFNTHRVARSSSISQGGSRCDAIQSATTGDSHKRKTALVIAFVIVLVLLLLFGGGTMTGATLSGGMMGNGAMSGVSWMWFPTLLMAGLGALLVWIIFGQKK